MSTKAIQKKLALIKDNNDHQHPVLNFSVLRQLIRTFKPELMDGSTASNKVLDLIAAYLSDPGERGAEQLEEILPESIFLALYGLKTLLKNRNWNTVQQLLENHKLRFEAFIQKELEEE